MPIATLYDRLRSDSGAAARGRAAQMMVLKHVGSARSQAGPWSRKNGSGDVFDIVSVPSRYVESIEIPQEKWTRSENLPLSGPFQE